MSRGRGSQSFALVSTLLIVAVMAMGALAFFQAARMDRLVSRSTANRVQAELAAESGLAAGRAAILLAITNGRLGTNQWNYISGHLASCPSISGAASNSDANAFGFISQVDPANGAVAGPSYLVSTSATSSNVWIPLGQTGADPRYPAHWTNIVVTNASGVVTTNARYAFWISDDTTKLNFRATGYNSSRSFPTDPSGVALMVRPTASSTNSKGLPAASLAGLVRPQSQKAADGSNLQGWNGVDLLRADSVLLTPGTIKAFMVNTGLTDDIPSQSLENDFTRETLSAPLAPNGRPKLNLTRLAYFLRHPDDGGLALNQGSASPRAQAVLNILDATATNAHANWGGGDLSFLTNTTIMGSKYSVNEARQFVANLFDALDVDKIPTTDWNAANPGADPTFLGTEFWMDTGKPQGHPFIVYVAGGYWASPTSCRSHLAVGFANPWPEPTEPWATKYILDPLEITPSLAQFPKILTEDGTGGDSLDAMPLATSIQHSSGGIIGKGGGMFPCQINAGGANPGIGPHYSAVVSGVTNTSGGSLNFALNKINLYYVSSSGNYLVARVPAPLSPLIVANNNFLANSVNNLAYASGRQALWLTSDPRLGSLGAAYWTIQNNGGSGSGLGIIPTSLGGGGLGAGGAGAVALKIMPPTDTDGAQGINPDIVASSSLSIWFRDSDITNHFNMDGSIEYDSAKNVNRIKGVGFLGYINSGKPWRTLSFNANNNLPGQEDWKILDYVYAGDEIYTSNEIAHVNMGSGTYAPDGARGSWPGNFSRDGSLNVHTGNRNTWRAFLEGVPVPAGVTADVIADAMQANPPNSPFSQTFAFLANTNVANAWFGSSPNDFSREQVVRYLADALTTRSRNFTVYAVGEVLATNSAGVIRPIARSYMLSRVRLGVNTSPDEDGNGGGIVLEVLANKAY